MTSIFAKIADQYRMAMQQFFSYGYLNYYKFLYGTSQFPYWFVLQSFYSCYVSHKNIEGFRKTPTLFVRQLISSFLMTFASREIFAFLFHKLSPIKHNPQSIIIFSAIYGLMCIKPIYQVVNFFAKLLGMAQGVNVARYFTLALRTIRDIPVELVLPTAITFSVLDQIIELVLRTILKEKESEIANKNIIVRSYIFCTIYWLFTHRNYFTQYIGIHSVYFPGLILALVLAASNSSQSILVQNQEMPQQQSGNDNNTNDNANNNGDYKSENERLKNLISQLVSDNNRLKQQLSEEQQKAREENDKLNAEIQRLKESLHQ